MKSELSRGSVRPLKASDRLELTGKACSFLIVKGHVRIFAQKDRGKLEPLFTCGPGDALIGSPELVSRWKLVAIGLPEASLAPLDLESLAKEAATQGPSRMLILLLENWVSRLLSSTCPSSTRTAEAYVPAEGVAFVGVEGGIYVLRHRFVWLKLAHPTILWGRSFEGMVAWPAHLALRCDSETKGEVIGSAAALGTDEAWQRLRELEQDCFAWLEARLDVSREILVRREAELKAFQSRVAYAVESQQRVAPAEGNDETSSDVLSSSFVSALSVVCRAVGAKLKPPPLGVLKVTRDPLALCARASGFGYRRVNLDARWYEGDVGPLLGHVSDGHQHWVAMVRHRGAYRLHEGTGGLGVLLDETIDRRIDQAFQIYPSLPQKGLLKFLLFRQKLALLLCLALGAVLGVVAMLPIFVLEFFRGEGNDPSLVSKPIQLVWALLLWAGGLGFLGIFSQRMVSRIVSFTNARLSAAVFHRLLFGQGGAVARRSPADRSGVSVELISSEDRVLQTVYGVGAGLGLFTAGLASLSFLNPLSAFVCALVCALISVVFGTSLRNSRRAAKVLRDTQAELSSLSASLVGSVSSLRVSGASERAALMWSIQDAGQQYWRRIVMRGLLFRRRLIMFGVGSIVVTCLLTGDVREWIHNPVGVPTMGISMGLASVGIIVMGSAVAEFASTLDLVDEVKELAETPEAPVGVGVIPDGPSGFIEVDQLSYSVEGEGKMVIDQVSFTIKRGSFVAIVGPSGSGKSTLIRLLLGLVRANSGSIRFDGLDISTLDLVALREMSGVVLQSLSLPKGSLQSIVSGGRNLGKEQVLSALRIVGLGPLVDSLPMGVNTLITGHSGVLSGGQMQLLLLARAIAGAPRLVMLDEATSALDNQSQAQVMRAIEKLNATRVVVAHRLSTVRNADHIIVLDNGAVVQEGTFYELERQDGLFRRLVRNQLKGCEGESS